MTEWEIDNIIQSPTGKRMLSRVSPIYDNSIFMKFFYEGEGSEYDKVRKYFATLREQSFTKTVDWGIVLQERKYSIIPDDSLTLEQRRERLKIKLQHKYPLNPAILEKIAKERFKLDVYLDESTNPGCITFEVETFNSAKKFIDWLLIEKPAHLMIYAIIHKIVKFPAYVGIGEHRYGKMSIGHMDTVTIEPKKTTDELNGRLFIIEPGKVTIVRDGKQTVIPPESTIDNDELILRLNYPSGQRNVSLKNPRQALTADDINEVTRFAVEKEIFLNNAEEIINGVPYAKFVTITEYDLDLDNV